MYIRRFADGDGDGVGDTAGLRSRLGYPAALGVDAVWITAWYRSPMQDGGYGDGCRVPLPWSSEEPPFGFSPPGARRQSWLPQPAV